MNKNNIWLAIAGLLVIAAIVGAVIITKKNPASDNSDTGVTPVGMTSSSSAPQEPATQNQNQQVAPSGTYGGFNQMDQSDNNQSSNQPSSQSSYGSASGGSSSNNSSGSISTGSAPQVVTLGATSISGVSAVLHGSLTTNNAETYYSFEYGTTRDLGSVTEFVPISGSSGSSTLSLAVLNLKPNMTYYYRFNAQNAYGKVYGNINSFITTGNGASATSTYQTSQNISDADITTLAATSISRVSAVLNGLINTNNRDTYYSFEYGTSPLFGMVTEFVPLAGSSTPSKASIAVLNLNPATLYYYRLNAQNEFKKMNGSTATFVTLR